MFDLCLFALLNLLGAMSPGPDFAIITRYGLTGSRKSALLATFGVATALFVHVFYCISGIAFFLHSLPTLIRIIRILGALYLGYLGIRIFLQEKEQQNSEIKSEARNAFLAGFLTNLLNPKATVFLLSLFSQFATSMNSFKMKIAFGISIPLVATFWFTTLVYFMTHAAFLPTLQKHRRKFMLAMSGMLCLLSISGIFSSFF